MVSPACHLACTKNNDALYNRFNNFEWKEIMI